MPARISKGISAQPQGGVDDKERAQPAPGFTFVVLPCAGCARSFLCLLLNSVQWFASTRSHADAVNTVIRINGVPVPPVLRCVLIERINQAMH